MNIVDIADFYTRPLGKTMRNLIAHRIAPAIAEAPEHLVLGIGYAIPYLQPEARNLCFMAARSGVIAWPAGAPHRSALVDELALPLGDNSIDAVLLVHALEFAESAEELLAEVWRVMMPQGKLVVVVPNRRGLWSISDETPLGQGQPFSRGQMDVLLKSAQFSVTALDQMLVAPPWLGAKLVRSLEPLGRFGVGGLAGLIVGEATKQVHGYVSGRMARRAVPGLRPALLRGARTAKNT